ncbi:TonB-dependent receptor [Edaphobacter albus]|uniref:TonB-dependent receptor n=1 Tax=Edaphobacter sp. 4G125 TaxID=2763071 RepID=UPI001644BB9D|nr:TonB-dependent receptor [Edaphobacter sp. 4G125]QNI37971.1 TonB-dependent receptor [Edaphobacter sp. 4G125]
MKIKILMLCTVILFSVSLGRSQVANNTSLVGTVTDKTGSVIPFALVVGTNQNTKVQYSGKTNQDGYYSIPFVSPGTYNVTVSSSGFQTSTTSGVVVTTNVAVRTDVSLAAGSTESVINISADTPVISTDDALIGETVGQEMVRDLPLNGRNPLDLAATASNVTISAGGTMLTGNPPGVRASGSGTRPINNSISLDGISLMNNLIMTTTLTPNPDAVESVQTQNGNYPAQYGDYLGVHINMVTKSGSNAFHGTVFEYIQNDAFNAKSWLAPSTARKSQLRYNQFGGVIGGPVILPHLYNGRDKTFFMGSYQGLRDHESAFTIGTVMTNKMRAGDFSELTNKTFYNPNTRFTLCSAPTYACPAAQYAGNIIPVNPISAKILPYLSAPTGPGITSNWSGNLPSMVNLDSTVDRVDENIGEKIRLFGRFAWQGVSNYTQAVNLANTIYNVTKTRNGALGYTHIITPKLINDFRFGFNVLITQNVDQQYQTHQTSAGSDLGIPGFTADVDNANPGLTDMTISGYQGISQTGTNWFQDDRQLTFYDQINYALNKHNLMAGVSFRKFTIGRMGTNAARGSFTFDQTLNGATSGAGDGAAAFIGGSPTSYVSPQFQSKGEVAQWRDGFFVQDTWQVSQKLTVEYGLRYELPQVAYSLNGVGRIMDPTLTTLFPAIGGTSAQNAVSYPGFKFTNPNHDNISPRLGFAYRVQDKTVIRGGAGIYYNANQLNTYTLSFGSYPYAAAVTPSAGFGTTPSFTLSNPNVPAAAPWPGPANNPYQNIAISPNLPTARMYQWNVDIGRELWSNAGIELQYIGSRTIHLDESYYPNQPAPSPIAFSQSRRPNPAIGQIRLIKNDAFSTYHGFTAILRQRVYHGVNAKLSYTWSHALDTTVDSNGGGSAMWQGHLKLDYGNSNYDIRNRFVGIVSYALPGFDNRSLMIRRVLGGWQANAIVDLRTGAPLNVTLNTNIANVGGVGSPQRPNFAHQGKTTCSRQTVTGSGGSVRNSCIDATAYVNPAAGTFGNLHRNDIYGPGAANTNFSLFKTFPIREPMALQFRVEAFNLFNHPNPGNPNTVFGGPSFGFITTANTSYTTTGARVMQLSAKLNF